MRFLIACFVVAVTSSALPQSSNEFHSRYGEPDLERFQARPGISVTVEYGSDHLACQIVIEPPQPLIHQEEQTQFMSSEGVSEILEEVAPVASRGNVISRFKALKDVNIDTLEAAIRYGLAAQHEKD